MRSAFALAPFIACAAAHTIFQELIVNGASQGRLKGIRHPSYNGPITDVTSADVACNGGPNPLVTPYPSEVITIPAGATVTTQWHYTLTSNTGDGGGAEPIDPSHKGPIMTYLAPVANATQSQMSGLSWFKIYEDGYNAATNTWAVDKMIANGGKVTFTIPSCIKPGYYFLRHELIALHGAGSYPGAQLYMECAQIQITGGGTASPATVTFPGAYQGSDPGITVSIYYPPLTNYVIPGPRPFTCGGTSTNGTSSVSTATTTSRSTSTASTSTSSGCTVAKYGQCGGTGYTGCTTCASGSTCTKSNDFYSQCL